MSNKSGPRIITFANQKGGCAKTTSVVAVATALTLLDKRVLIVDMDSQANVSAGLGVKRLAQKEHKILSEVMRKNLKLPQVRMSTKNPKIDIVAADIGVNRAMLELIGRPRQHYVLAHLLDCPETAQYDVILVDTNPKLDSMLQSALVGSHFLLVPIFAEADAFDGLVDLFDEFHEIQRTYNPGLSMLGMFITRYDSKNTTHKKFSLLLKNWCEKNKIKLFDSMIPTSTAVAGARTAEKSVIEYNSSLPVSEAYMALAKDILPEISNRIGRKSEIPEITRSTTEVFDEVFMTE